MKGFYQRGVLKTPGNERYLPEENFEAREEEGGVGKECKSRFRSGRRAGEKEG